MRLAIMRAEEEKENARVITSIFFLSSFNPNCCINYNDFSLVTERPLSVPGAVQTIYGARHTERKVL